MTRIDSPPDPMNLGNLQTRTLSPSLDQAGAVRALGTQEVSEQLHASGSRLLGLDVWAGSSAIQRTLHTGTGNLPAGSSLDQLAAHILAPLGH